MFQNDEARMTNDETKTEGTRPLFVSSFVIRASSFPVPLLHSGPMSLKLLTDLCSVPTAPFAEQARVAVLGKNWEQSYNGISRCQKIIAELTASLKHATNPELFGKLSSLYNYAHRKLVEANVGHHIEPLDEAIKVLQYQRETWALLLEQLGKQKAGQAAGKIDMPAPSAAMEAKIRLSA